VPTWLIIVLVVLAILAVGGMIARAMITRRTEEQFQARLEQANHDLAEAAAADKGWDRATLESAARRIYSEQRGTEPAELLLVEALDRPGTEDDLAVFSLGRHDGEWVFKSLE
jgi:type II secretory pathway pseudopilin PulG